MTKQTIIRYLKKELTSTEINELFNWIEASDSNRQYFNNVKNLWTASSLQATPDMAADFSDLQTRILGINTKVSRFTRVMSVVVKAAAILTIPLTIGILWLASQRKIEPLVQLDNPIVSIYTPLCARSEVILPDGTKVWLNSGSKLTYPRLFAGNTREVALEGEAYFDVTKNESYPFVVKTPHQVDVHVKGTSFNLCAYVGDVHTEITLVNGAVDFINEHSGEKVTMKPQQFVRYEKDKNTFSLRTEVNTALYTAWKDGVLVFDNASMQDLSKRLERWYGVNITIEDPRILNFTYTGKFKEETIGQVLELIRQSSSITYRMEDKRVFLSRKQ